MKDYRNDLHYRSVLSYFSKKARKYDLVDTQLYWRLSDELLWYALRKILSENKPKNEFNLLDAGGGTGRWSIKIGEYIRSANVHIVDASIEMLDVAKEKIQSNSMKNVFLHNFFLEELDRYFSKNFFQITIILHNVLGFVKNPLTVMKKISYVTERMIISFVPNLYHLIYFNIKTKNIDEALYAVKNKSGRFTRNMPVIHAFTPMSIKRIYRRAGMKKVKVYGFPKFIYPGEEETKIVGNSKKIENILSNKYKFKKILSIEKKYMFDENSASRGNMLLVIGTK